MSQPEQPKTAFRAILSTVSGDYRIKAANAAEQASRLVLDLGTIDEAERLLKSTSGTTDLARDANRLGPDIDEIITAKGFPVPGQDILKRFLPPNPKSPEPASASNESTPTPHPLAPVFDVMRQEIQIQAADAAGRAREHYSRGELDEGDEASNKGLELTRRAREINPVAEEIIKLIGTRGHSNGITDDILTRTALMIQIEETPTGEAGASAGSFVGDVSVIEMRAGDHTVLAPEPQALTTVTHTADAEIADLGEAMQAHLDRQTADERLQTAADAEPDPKTQAAIARGAAALSALEGAPPGEVAEAFANALKTSGIPAEELISPERAGVSQPLVEITGGPFDTPAAATAFIAARSEEPRIIRDTTIFDDELSPIEDIGTLPPPLVTVDAGDPDKATGTVKPEIADPAPKLQIIVEGNEVVCNGQQVELNDAQRAILLRLPVAGAGLIKAQDAYAGLFEEYSMPRSKYMYELGKLRDALKKISGGEDLIHSELGPNGGIAIKARVEVPEPTAPSEGDPTTISRPTEAASVITSATTEAVSAIITTGTDTQREEATRRPGSIDIMIEGSNLVVGDRQIPLRPDEIAILSRLVDESAGYTAAKRLQNGLEGYDRDGRKLERTIDGLQRRFHTLLGRPLIKPRKGVGYALDNAQVIRREPAAPAPAQTEQAPGVAVTTAAQIPSERSSTARPEMTERAPTDISIADETVARELLAFDEKADRFKHRDVRDAAKEIFGEQLDTIGDGAQRANQEMTYAAQIDVRLRIIAGLILEGRKRRDNKEAVGYEKLVELATWVDKLTYKGQHFYRNMGLNGLHQAMSRGWSFDSVKEAALPPSQGKSKSGGRRR